jgi:hypothetical protein
MKNHQIYQLFIQFIDYVWYLLHVSALHCHLQGVFLVVSERCSIEEQLIEYCGWACFVVCGGGGPPPTAKKQKPPTPKFFGI